MNRYISNCNLPPAVAQHVKDSWRPKTRTQYAVYQRKWQTYCVLHDIDQLNPGLKHPLSFLCQLFDTGIKYGSLNTARSALSCVLTPIGGHKFGVHPITLRVMRSFYNKRPPTARYAQMWNPQIVIDFLREWVPLNRLSLKDLTLKLVMLLLLSTCSRLQRVHSIKRTNIVFENDGSMSIKIDEVQKHSSRGKSLEVINLKPFTDDRGVCVVFTLKEYLLRTKDISNAEHYLFCSYMPPYARVGIPTIGRWTKTVMARAGVDIAIYKAHSTRGASASALAKAGTPLQEILKKGAWSHESTFKQFYLRDIPQV